MKVFRFFSRRFAIGALLTVLGGILQASGIAAVSGVRPNVLLVVLTVLAFFFWDWVMYAGILSIVIVFAKSEVGFEAPYLALILISGAVFLLKQRLPGNQFSNTTFAIGVGTVLTYAVADPAFLTNDPITILIEVFYNMLVGIVVYLVAERTIGHEPEFRTSR